MNALIYYISVPDKSPIYEDDTCIDEGVLRGESEADVADQIDNVRIDHPDVMYNPVRKIVLDFDTVAAMGEGVNWGLLDWEKV